MSANEPDDGFERFRVEPWLDWFGGVVARHPRLVRRLGDLETRRLDTALDAIQIEAPIFVCGLARSGSTILLECLAAHPNTVTHRYRDYPGVLAPVLWDRVSDKLYARNAAPAERAHRDGIAVTPDSPEAMEEMIWMAFYRHAHDPAGDNSVERVSPDFAAFYRDHIRKLLWLRGGKRYLAKGNYNLARLDALLDLFPDARFIIPLRDPVAHVSSLMRQQALFCAAETKHPAALRYMQRSGHFEFGLDRRPLNLGGRHMTSEVMRLWEQGKDVEGWALYWASVHDFLADRLEASQALRQAVVLVRFEELCADPRWMLARILDHAGLAAEDAWVRALAGRIRVPRLEAILTTQDVEAIRRLTAPAASRLGVEAAAIGA